MWWIDISYNGARVRRSLKTKNKKLAQHLHNKIATMLVEGTWLEGQKQSKVTFTETAERYMEEYSSVYKRSYKRDKSSLRHLLPFFGHYTLSEIRPAIVAVYKTKRRKEGASPATINREIALLKHIFTVAHTEWELCKEHPLKGLKMEKEPSPRDRWLTKEEEEQLLLHSPEWLKGIVIFALDTGCRRGEIVDLKWKDVDLIEEKVTIFGTKTESSRTIPLTKQLVDLLKQKKRKESSEYVFTNSIGKKLDKDKISRSFKEACKRAGIENFRFHDLRHTFATRLAQKGVDPYTVQKLLGHKCAQTMQRYAHHCLESLRPAIAVLEKEYGTNLSQKDLRRDD
jgi:integrase